MSDSNVVVITGASPGIGRATAVKYVEASHLVELRRAMPAGPVEMDLRKTVWLA